MNTQISFEFHQEKKHLYISLGRKNYEGYGLLAKKEYYNIIRKEVPLILIIVYKKLYNYYKNQNIQNSN